MTTERLQKFLSRAGVASRRTAEEIIQAGRVAVNGQVVTAMGVKVDPDRDVVQVDGSTIKVTAALRTVMLHKPYGYVCTTRDPEGRRVVTELLGKTADRLYPVGRLDYDATGLLLLTNDGELAYRLTHPSYLVPRTYRVTVAGEVSKEKVRELAAGVDLEGRFVYPEVQVNKREPGKTVLEITVHEGRYHLIKRLMDQVGHPVVKLKRLAFGPLRLEGLLRGAFREVTGKEMAALKGRGGPEVNPEERPFPPEMIPESWREAGFMPPRPAPKPPRLLLHLGLLLATVVTTVIAGALQQGVDPLDTPELLYKGIPFSFTLLLILGAHEMGHYLVSRRHHLDVTLPFFIPAPPIMYLPFLGWVPISSAPLGPSSASAPP